MERQKQELRRRICIVRNVESLDKSCFIALSGKPDRVGLYPSALEYSQNSGEVSTGSPFTAAHQNVHKIRVYSDKKRLARCTETALTQSRKRK
jgi:hypothetical protein